MGQEISKEFAKLQQPLNCCAPCSADPKSRGENDEFRRMQPVDEVLPGKPGTPLNNSDNGSNRDISTPTRQFSFRNMTRQDYFSLYDAIHTLVRQEEISKEQENTLYDLIGRQDKRLAAAYQTYKEAGNPTVLLDALKDRVSSGRISTRSRDASV